jgi:peptide-methionine (S)-S-oxide reductase
MNRSAVGATGHAEVVRIEYDPDSITLDTVLDLFFEAHDPTMLNRQGSDVGTQYRSVILWSNESEIPVIEAALSRAKEKWGDVITTEVKKLESFYPAEDYHQNYYNKHPDQPYCAIVIAPKLEKFLKKEK